MLLLLTVNKLKGESLGVGSSDKISQYSSWKSVQWLKCHKGGGSPNFPPSETHAYTRAHTHAHAHTKNTAILQVLIIQEYNVCQKLCVNETNCEDHLIKFHCKIWLQLTTKSRARHPDPRKREKDKNKKIHAQRNSTTFTPADYITTCISGRRRHMARIICNWQIKRISRCNRERWNTALQAGRSRVPFLMGSF